MAIRRSGRTQTTDAATTSIAGQSGDETLATEDGAPAIARGSDASEVSQSRGIPSQHMGAAPEVRPLRIPSLENNARGGARGVPPLQAGEHGNAAERIEVLAWGSPRTLTRPCVDCGLVTGRYCDWCFAASRLPDERWAPGQRTLLCSNCDNRFDACHFCRGVMWATLPSV